LQVTALGYGSMELRGAPRARDTTEAQAETILNAELDAGINFIDTSIDYGVSEERIGRYISHRRSEYYLASKCGCLVGVPAVRGQISPHVFTRDNILAGVEQSLIRMKTDYLDLVQFHISPSKQTLEENGTLDAVLELTQAGKVHRHGRNLAASARPYRHGPVRRVSDSLLGDGTRARSDHFCCLRSGVGHHHTGRRG
jgi:aryl-alcohol dehydrogenase-like predicted oxidoreductase